MKGGEPNLTLTVVGRFILSHRHAPGECAAAYAAWHGFDSPLRHHATISSCVEGGHAIWWTVSAESGDAALALLPPFVAERTTSVRVREVQIP
jgi:hypothetical protein